MPSTSLRSSLNDLAQSFANGVLAAIRTASIEDLLAESGGHTGRRTGGGGGASQTTIKKARGRLARRSLEDIQRTLDRVVGAVKASNGKGLRAEEIRKALSLDVREVPRVLKQGLKTKKLRAKGRRRATTYFAK